MFFIIVAIGCSIFLSFLLLYVPGPAPNPPNIQPVSRGAGGSGVLKKTVLGV